MYSPDGFPFFNKSFLIIKPVTPYLISFGERQTRSWSEKDTSGSGSETLISTSNKCSEVRDSSTLETSITFEETLISFLSTLDEDPPCSTRIAADKPCSQCARALKLEKGTLQIKETRSS